MVEAIFIVTIVALLISGLVAGIIYSGRVAYSSKYRAWAIELAQKKMEEWRSMKEGDPESFWNLVAGATTPIREGVTNPATFDLTTTFTDYQVINGLRRVKVTIEVEWREGDQSRTARIISYLTD